MKQKLKEMISAHAYDEIVGKIKKQVGQDVFDIIWPSIKKALEEGDGDVRYKILISWLDCDHVRVCSYCGRIMEKGWYLDANGYACSDECAAKAEGITMEEFDKWKIYKDDIISYLEREGYGGTIQDYTKEECEEFINNLPDDLEHYYTEWY